MFPSKSIKQRTKCRETFNVTRIWNPKLCRTIKCSRCLLQLTTASGHLGKLGAGTDVRNSYITAAVNLFLQKVLNWFLCNNCMFWREEPIVHRSKTQRKEMASSVRR
ncbi:hypothetical protein GDO81_026060 [Engystomops pustulosus]|uniref:Uncharacterized protein n=1 Tax=Engystomops pustulosus TaxID=76066 RepID=A0AAV6YN30_ENGPU|nr:hypothetical protein GDO81_026060 [Engystomops pustulosus]